MVTTKENRLCPDEFFHFPKDLENYLSALIKASKTKFHSKEHLEYFRQYDVLMIALQLFDICFASKRLSKKNLKLIESELTKMNKNVI